MFTLRLYNGPAGIVKARAAGYNRAGKPRILPHGKGAGSLNIYDISQLAGVSIATVSRVLNDSARVSEKTKQKVLRVIEENGYTPNAFARGLGLNTMHTVGLLCADSADPYLAKAVCELERKLRAGGYDSLLCCTGYAHETKEKYLTLLLSKHVDGVILVGSHFVEQQDEGNAYIRRAAQETPVLLLGGALDGPNLYAVQCDERAAMREATARLLRSGRQRVLYLYNSMSYSGRNKLLGYREGYAQMNLTPPEGLELMLDAYQFDVVQVRQLLCDKWQSGLRFDAVLASEDRLAVGAAKFAKRQGLRIPGELAVIGCNNSPIARYCEPELTSIDNQLDALCGRCVDTLMDVLHGKYCPKKAVFDALLVQRESTDFSCEG